MSLFTKLFKKQGMQQVEPLLVDMHSHLLPGLDDGAQNLEESLVLVRNLVELGYKKLIMTPHIMGDFYKNSEETIRPAFEKLSKAVMEEGLTIQLAFAAEYYLDEWFMKKLDDNEPLLTFGNNNILVETSYMNRPNNLDELLFKLQSKGYKPIIAHPERYVYLYADFEEYKKIYEKGVLYQVNINSLTGYYSPRAKKIAEKLIKNNMVELLGTDCHTLKHIGVLKKARQTSLYKKALSQSLLNNTLL